MVNNDFIDIYKEKKVFITGHTGFKGSWLTYLLTSLGANVTGYSLESTIKPNHFEMLGLEQKINHIIADIRDYNRLQKEISKFQPEFIFHLAAQSLVRSSYIDPRSTYETNVSGGISLLEAVRNCKSVRSLVFITSDKCYENQEWIWGYRESDTIGGYDPYSASKGAIEIIFSSYLRSFFNDRKEFGAATCRAGNVIGGGDWSLDRIVPDCVRSVLEGRAIIIRNPNATRPWQHVLEPISGYIKLAYYLYLNGNKFNGAWNFGPDVGNVKTVLQVANSLASEFKNTEVVVKHINDKHHEANLLQLNTDKAKQFLKWFPKWDFDTSIKATVDWYKKSLNRDLCNSITKKQINEYFELSL